MDSLGPVVERMRTWVPRLVAVLAAGALSAGCTGAPDLDPQDPVTQRQSVTEWRRAGDRWCEYYRLGDRAIAGLRCAKQVADQPQPTFDIFMPPDAVEPVYRQAFPPELEEYVFIYWPKTERWTRQLASGAGAVDYCYLPTGGTACEWVSPSVYAELLQKATEQGQLSQEEAQRQQQQAGAAAEVARENARRFQLEAQQRALELGRIWAAPDCVHSSNGCGP